MNEQVQEPRTSEEGVQPRSLAEALEIMPAAAARRLRLARLAGWHGLVWLGALGLFAAADSWVLLSGPWASRPCWRWSPAPWRASPRLR